MILSVNPSMVSGWCLFCRGNMTKFGWIELLPKDCRDEKGRLSNARKSMFLSQALRTEFWQSWTEWQGFKAHAEGMLIERPYFGHDNPRTHASLQATFTPWEVWWMEQVCKPIDEIDPKDWKRALFKGMAAIEPDKDLWPLTYMDRFYHDDLARILERVEERCKPKGHGRPRTERQRRIAHDVSCAYLIYRYWEKKNQWEVK